MNRLLSNVRCISNNAIGRCNFGSKANIKANVLKIAGDSAADFDHDFEKMQKQMILRRWEQCVRKRTGKKRFTSRLVHEDSPPEGVIDDGLPRRGTNRKVGRL